MEKEVDLVLGIINDIKNGLDTPFYYFDLIEDDLRSIFEENKTMPPSTLLLDYEEAIGHFCDVAPTKESFEKFSTIYYIIRLVLDYYLTDLITVG